MSLLDNFKERKSLFIKRGREEKIYSFEFDDIIKDRKFLDEVGEEVEYISDDDRDGRKFTQVFTLLDGSIFAQALTHSSWDSDIIEDFDEVEIEIISKPKTIVRKLNGKVQMVGTTKTR